MALDVKLLLVPLAVYMALLFLANCVPGLRVRSLHFLGLSGVTVSSRTAIVSIHRVRLKIHWSKALRSPLKACSLHLHTVSVFIHPSTPKPHRSSQKNDIRGLEESASILIPEWASRLVPGPKWLDQATICISHLRVHHHAFEKDVYFHLDFLKVENSCDEDAILHRISFSAMDGHLLHDIDQPRFPALHLFHNFEIAVSTNPVFTCLASHPGKIQVLFSNLKIHSVISVLQISELLLNSTERKKFLSASTKGPVQKSDPSLVPILRIINYISAFQVKIEHSKAEWGHMQLVSSSYSLEYYREESYKQLMVAKLSANLTGAKFYHRGLKCVEFPSFTQIVNIDLTSFQRSMGKSAHSPEQFLIDSRTTLTFTNPSFVVFHDQLNPLLNLIDLRREAREARKLTPSYFPMEKLQKYGKYIGKVFLKIIVIDLKGQLHLPRSERGNFHRQNVENVITNVGAQVLAFKTSTKSFHNIIQREYGLQKLQTVKGFFKTRNVYSEVEENKIFMSALNVLAGYCLQNDRVALRVSFKRLQVKSVNSMIFHVIRKIRETRIKDSNFACTKLRKDMKARPELKSRLSSEDATRQLIDLFNILPSVIHSVRIRASLVLTFIICKDWLPSHVLYDESLEKDVDLADFKRGVAFTASDFNFEYKRDEESIEGHLRQLQANTLSEYTSEYVEDFDKKNENPLGEFYLRDDESMDSGLSTFSSINGQEDVQTVKKVLQIQDVIIRNPDKNRSKLVLSIPEIDARIDIFLFWCLMYARRLVQMLAPEVEEIYSAEEKRQLRANSRTINFDIDIGSLSAVVRLPHDVDVLFELDSLHLKNLTSAPHSEIRFIRLYVIHPITKLWCRLVSISDADVNLDSVTSSSIQLNTRAVRLNIPFQFLVYTVIDNVITFAKAVMQINENFTHLSKDIKDYKRIEPHAKDAVKIPRIRWKSNSFGTTIEMDAFERELAIIYDFGMVEHTERKRKMAIFERKAKALRSQASESLSQAEVSSSQFLNGKASQNKKKPHLLTKKLFNIGEDNSLKEPNGKEPNGIEQNGKEQNGSEPSRLESLLCKSSRRNSGSIDRSNKSEAEYVTARGSKTSKASKSQKSASSGEEPIPESPSLTEDVGMTEEKAERIIAEAYEKLQKDFATSYIHKFKKFKHEYFKSWAQKLDRVCGEDKVNDLMRSKYDIQDFAPGCPQFHGGFHDFDLTLDDPHLDDIHNFLKVHGKGQPRFQYSILIPVAIHLKSSCVYMSARDYPLPLISFPSNGDPDNPAMDLRGTLVINEKLVGRPEELRQIFVPFSPATASQKVIDNFYSVNVIRTLTPVKAMFDLRFKLDTDRACIVSWCKAYQPALLSIMMAFENFTKPEIDDSPLGWWDKLGLNAHGRMVFDIKNELCLHIKSSTSPYALVGDSSGLVFCWKENVSLRINDSGKHAELVKLESDDFILAIPNYAASEGRAWSLLNSMFDEEQDDISDFGKFQKRLMKFTSDERVCWTAGFLFERNVDPKATELSPDMERTNVFKPHYDVVVTGPQYEYHPDSFEGFRSDYTHLAISVNSTSVKGNAHNYAYYSPLTVAYFKKWWSTLNDTISLPIREGKLFAKLAFKQSSVKFGPHLFTFKYQLVLEPLTLTNMYLSYGDKEADHRVVAYGIKGKSSKCVIDLHQRREVARYVNDKLGIDKKIRKLKMNMGEIEVADADIRLVHANFSDVSMTGKILSYYRGESDSHIDFASFENYMKEHSPKVPTRPLNLYQHDTLWIDFDDFIELEENEVLSPDTDVNIIPFFSTPRFTYFREFSLEHPGGKFPFGNEASHKCLIGVNSPELVQAELIETRVNEIKQKLKADKSQLIDSTNDEARHHACPMLRAEIASGQHKMEKLQRIYGGIASIPLISSIHDLSRAATRLSAGEDLRLMRREKSRTPSIYLGIKSLEQAREVINANSLVSNFHNRYLFHNFKLEWNNRVRDVFTAFLDVVQHKKSEALSMKQSVLDLLEKFLNRMDSKKEEVCEKTKSFSEERFACSDDVIGAFDEYLTEVSSDSEEVNADYLVKFIKPQICFLSDTIPDDCVLLTAKDVELRVMGVNSEGSGNIVTESDEYSSLLETRYGVMFSDFYVFAFKGKQESAKRRVHWLNLEDSDEISSQEDNLIVEKTTMALTVKKPNMLSASSSETQSKRSELIVQMAKLVINATSSQYSSFYFILTDLLIHGSKTNYFQQRLQRITALSDGSDFQNLPDKVKLLQENIRICKYVLMKLNEKNLFNSKEKERQQQHIRFELCRMKVELQVILKSLEWAGYTGVSAMTRNWTVNVDQIILHFLNDQREPLIDFALATSKFNRLEEIDGSNTNSVSIQMIQGFNLKPNAPYPELIRPYFEIKEEKKNSGLCQASQPIIQMRWKMLNPVGGIRVMSNAEMLVQPIDIELDYDTATELFNYLFPKDKERQKDSRTSHSSPESDDETEPESPTTSGNTFRKLLNRSGRSDSASEFSRVSTSTKESINGESVSVNSHDSWANTERKALQKTRGMLQGNFKKKNKQTPYDDIALIMTRLDKYFVVGDFKMNEIKLCISFKAPKHLNIIDVHKLQFPLPMLHYRDKTWTNEDFVQQLKKDVVKVFLSHTGRIIGNKFKVRQRNRANVALKQISDYSQYMTLEELQEEGRPRDHKKIQADRKRQPITRSPLSQPSTVDYEEILKPELSELVHLG